VSRERGGRITRLMLQQVAEAGDKPTSFTIHTGGETWDFHFGKSFTLADLPKKQALPKN